jgi:anti-sigma regulatory factor (Ser/Thr protein kinase)
MQDLSLHVLDIVENSIAAGARRIKITIIEDTGRNKLTLTIQDNGVGMDKKIMTKALDPFFSTKKTRRIGLGLSMLAQATKEANGDFHMKSKKGKGTTITATFVHDHIDRKPIGDMTETLITLIATQGRHVDFSYEHRKNNYAVIFDTKTIKQDLNDIPLNNPEVIKYLRDNLKKQIKKLDERSNK